MIITRTPLRIPIAGGGTDLPEFYEKYGSFFISAAIDYYTYIVVKRRPIRGIRLGHSKIEEVKRTKDIEHPIIQTILKYLKIKTERGLEIVSIGDFPAGTGMGTSGSFTVGLLNALNLMLGKKVPANVLAKSACHINMDILKGPSGIQDEYITAYGGITCFEVNKKGIVKIYPLKISSNTIKKLHSNLLMFYTGVIRNSNTILAKQRDKTLKKDTETISNLLNIQKIGYEIKNALEKGDTNLFGKLMDKHWMTKRKRDGTTSKIIDKWYKIARDNGALGGKIMGAGGGGFFLFYCEDNKKSLRKALVKEGLEEVRFNFDFEGSKLITAV